MDWVCQISLSQGLACMAVFSPHFIVSMAPLPCTPGISCEYKSDWARLASSTHFNNGYQMRGLYIHRWVPEYSAYVCVRSSQTFCNCLMAVVPSHTQKKKHTQPSLSDSPAVTLHQLHLFSLPFSSTCSFTLPKQEKT